MYGPSKPSGRKVASAIIATVCETGINTGGGFNCKPSTTRTVTITVAGVVFACASSALMVAVNVVGRA